MDWRRGGGVIKGMAEGFAINGHHITPGCLTEGSGPRDEAARQLVWIQPRQDPSKGVVARNAMRQVQQIGEPFLLGLAVLFNVLPPLCPTDDSTHRNDEDIHQEMTAIRRRGAAEIGQRSKIVLKRCRGEQTHVEFSCW